MAIRRPKRRANGSNPQDGVRFGASESPYQPYGAVLLAGVEGHWPTSALTANRLHNPEPTRFGYVGRRRLCPLRRSRDYRQPTRRGVNQTKRATPPALLPSAAIRAPREIHLASRSLL